MNQQNLNSEFCFLSIQATNYNAGMASDRREHFVELRLRPPNHRLEREQGRGRQLHRVPSGRHLLNVLQ